MSPQYLAKKRIFFSLSLQLYIKLLKTFLYINSQLIKDNSSGGYMYEIVLKNFYNIRILNIDI